MLKSNAKPMVSLSPRWHGRGLKVWIIFNRLCYFFFIYFIKNNLKQNYLKLFKVTPLAIIKTLNPTTLMWKLRTERWPLITFKRPTKDITCAKLLTESDLAYLLLLSLVFKVNKCSNMFHVTFIRRFTRQYENVIPQKSKFQYQKLSLTIIYSINKKNI